MKENCLLLGGKEPNWLLGQIFGTPQMNWLAPPKRIGILFAKWQFLVSAIYGHVSDVNSHVAVSQQMAWENVQGFFP